MGPVAVASGPTDGVTPPTTATAATRCASPGVAARKPRRRGAGQKRVRATAGQADDAQPFGVQGVCHLSDVGGPVDHRAVGVRVGKTRTRSLHHDDPQAEVLSGTPAEERELAPAAGSAMEPQHHRAGRIAVLGVAQPTPSREVEAPFGARLLDVGHAEGVPPGIFQVHRSFQGPFEGSSTRRSLYRWCPPPG
jgi:hypothetical protein